MNLTPIKDAIKKLAPVLPVRSTLPVLSCVKLTAGDGKLIIEACNLEQHASVVLPFDGADFSCCCSHRALSQLPGDEGLIIPTPEFLTIKGKGFSSTIQTLDAGEFAGMDLPFDQQRFTLDADCSEALKWVARAVGNDETQLQFTGICFNSLGMCGTNRRRAHIAPFAADLGGIIVPYSPVLLDLFREGAVITWGKGMFGVEFENMKFMTRLIAGQYPNIGAVIPGSECSRLSINVDDLRSRLSLLHPQHKEIWPCVDIDSTNNVTTLLCQSDGVENRLDVPCGGDNVSFRSAHRFFIDMLHGFTGEHSIEFRGAASMLIRHEGRVGMVAGMARNAKDQMAASHQPTTRDK